MQQSFRTRVRSFRKDDRKLIRGRASVRHPGNKLFEPDIKAFNIRDYCLLVRINITSQSITIESIVINYDFFGNHPTHFSNSKHFLFATTCGPQVCWEMTIDLLLNDWWGEVADWQPSEIGLIIPSTNHQPNSPNCFQWNFTSCTVTILIIPTPQIPTITIIPTAPSPNPYQWLYKFCYSHVKHRHTFRWSKNDWYCAQ